MYVQFTSCVQGFDIAGNMANYRSVFARAVSISCSYGCVILTLHRRKYLRMDQVEFVEHSL